MPMKDYREFGEKLIFTVFYLFSMFSMHSDRLNSYWSNNGTPYMLFRYVLIAILIVFSVLINQNNIRFITKVISCTVPVITALLIIDYYIFHISGTSILYTLVWLSYILTTLMSLFIVTTLFGKYNYPTFYKSFWRAFLPLYLFTIIICFLRRPGDNLTLNLELGQGTILMLRAMIDNIQVSFEAPLIFFGNVGVFVPLPFILSAVSNKLTPPKIMIIGFITPFLAEGYQFIFKCGQVDVDDIVLNFGGLLIAYLVYILIYKFILKDTATA